MNKMKRAAAITAAVTLIFAWVSVNAAHGNATGEPLARGVATAVPAAQPPAQPVPTTEPSAPPLTSSGSVNGNAGDVNGIPFYDVDSDTTLIQYPDYFSEDVLANANVWVEMMALTAACMDSKGYPFEYTLWWESQPETDPQAAARILEPSAKHGTPAYEALYGDPFAPDYDAQAGAGCDGQARAQLEDNPLVHAN